MHLHKRRVFLLLTLLALSACQTGRPPAPGAVFGAAASPTPFQPAAQDLLQATLGPSTPLATFTPYPTAAVRPVVPALHAQIAPPPAGTDVSAALLDPLTGLPPSDPNLLQGRPVAVKVTNYPRYVRPQYGLTEADVVFEYYIEGLLTRFIAVFYGSSPNMVGPVRSGRYFDEHVARMYHAFYVFQYADPRELTYFMSGDLRDFLVLQGPGDCPPFFLSHRAIETYNNAYFDLTKWAPCAQQLQRDNSPQSLRSGFFSAALPSGAAPALHVYTRYSFEDYHYWEYDAPSGRYLRYQETVDAPNDDPPQYAPLVDGLTGQQVAADNVIELFVPHSFLNAGEQQDEVYHINLVDSGYAVVFRDGLGVPARWMRTDISQPLLISSLDGAPLFLKPGQTFYEVIGQTSKESAAGGDWHFEFQTP